MVSAPIHRVISVQACHIETELIEIADPKIDPAGALYAQTNHRRKMRLRVIGSRKICVLRIYPRLACKSGGIPVSRAYLKSALRW